MIQLVEFFGLGNLANHGERFEAEGVSFFKKEIINYLVEALGVNSENLCGINGEGTVDVNWHVWNFSGFGQFVENVDELLCPLDRECWDDHLPVFLECPDEDVAQQVICLRWQFVFAIAVGAFHDEIVDVIGDNGITKKFVVASTDIAGEEEALLFPVFNNIENYLGRSEDVTGVDECEGDAIRNRNGALVSDVHKVSDAFLGILFRIKWFEKFLASLFPTLVEPLRILNLDARRIRQHDLAEVARCKSGVDVPVEAILCKVGQIATVIDVRVRNHNSVDGGGSEEEVTVSIPGVVTPSLIETAIEKNAGAICFEEVL